MRFRDISDRFPEKSDPTPIPPEFYCVPLGPYWRCCGTEERIP